MNELYTSFSHAVTRLEEALEQEHSTIVQDAAIQRFEFATELMWKSLQKHMRGEGILCNSPKHCLQEAFTMGLIEDDPLWLQMLHDRNLTSHTYNEQTAKEVFGRLASYLPLYRKVEEVLQ